MTVVYIGLGANLGDRAATLERALAYLRAEPELHVLAVSQVRETAPVGLREQPAFLNAAAALETTLAPRALLDRLLAIERRLGRTREGLRWGPRTIDRDLLVHGDAVVARPGLQVPHPRLAQRRFVLEPLTELAPDLVVPDLGPVAVLLARCTEPPEV